MTIAESFQELLRRIQPTQAEINATEQHLATIKTRLADAYTLKKFVKAGSYSRGTFIRGHSDVDVFAMVSRDDVRWGGRYVSSNTVLNNFKMELSERFWDTDVRRDVHAIVLDFWNCQIDVVPAFFAGVTKNNYPLYSIPDGSGDWMKTSPELHNAWIAREDRSANGKIRGTARLMKFWRECRSPRIPLSSFHIEVVLAATGICKGVKSYAQCITELLQNLAERECRAIQDPLGISGNIPAVKTLAQRGGAQASVRNSRDHAKAALVAERSQNIREARRQWDIVFNDEFPW